MDKVVMLFAKAAVRHMNVTELREIEAALLELLGDGDWSDDPEGVETTVLGYVRGKLNELT